VIGETRRRKLQLAHQSVAAQTVFASRFFTFQNRHVHLRTVASAGVSQFLYTTDASCKSFKRGSVRATGLDFAEQFCPSPIHMYI
jgi:hypothetical protein